MKKPVNSDFEKYFVSLTKCFAHKNTDITPSTTLGEKVAYN